MTATVATTTAIRNALACTAPTSTATVAPTAATTVTAASSVTIAATITANATATAGTGGRAGIRGSAGAGSRVGACARAGAGSGAVRGGVSGIVRGAVSDDHAAHVAILTAGIAGDQACQVEVVDVRAGQGGWGPSRGHGSCKSRRTNLALLPVPTSPKPSNSSHIC